MSAIGNPGTPEESPAPIMAYQAMPIVSRLWPAGGYAHHACNTRHRQPLAKQPAACTRWQKKHGRGGAGAMPGKLDRWEERWCHTHGQYSVFWKSKTHCLLVVE